TAFEAVAPVRTGLGREHEDAAPEDAPAVVDRIAQLAGEAHAEDRLPGIAGGEPTSVEVVVVDAERERVGPAQRLREVQAPNDRGVEAVHLHAAAAVDVRRALEGVAGLARERGVRERER